jgi:hypothetical protein
MLRTAEEKSPQVSCLFFIEGNDIHLPAALVAPYGAEGAACEKSIVSPLNTNRMYRSNVILPCWVGKKSC